MSKITIIGDVHQKIEQYLEITNNNEYTVQVGDMGFNYAHLNYIDDRKHKFFGGNHDCYQKLNNEFVSSKYQHWLGDYGWKSHNTVEFFFIRGGHSIDWRHRENNIDMFYDEEIPLRQWEDLKEKYLDEKPRIVLSHECPTSIIQPFFGPFHYAGNWIEPSNTATMLDWLFKLHKPELWVFGHFHQRRDKVYEGTRFVCLEELGTVEIEV